VSAATTVPVIDRTHGQDVDHACSGSWLHAGRNAAGHDVYACDSGRHLLIDRHRSADHQCLTVLDCLSPVVAVPAS